MVRLGWTEQSGGRLKGPNAECARETYRPKRAPQLRISKPFGLAFRSRVYQPVEVLFEGNTP